MEKQYYSIYSLGPNFYIIVISFYFFYFFPLFQYTMGNDDYYMYRVYQTPI